MNIENYIPLFIAVFVIVSFIGSAIKIVKEYERGVIFRLGRLIGAKGPGLFFIIPGVDQMVKIDLRTITFDARSIKIITKDNIRCDVDSFVYYRVVDPTKAVTEVENYIPATQNMSKTVLRDVLGHAELDDLLVKTEELTKNIQLQLDAATDPWGIKVTAVVISDVTLPSEMERAIAKQAEAEREKRSRIIIAEGEFIAAQKMMEAAELYMKSPISLKIRELQTMAEIAREKNMVVVTSTTSLQDLGNVVALSKSLQGSK
jgi:regulator of protease activity HflC (stomatin/prohibitin superfamily)